MGRLEFAAKSPQRGLHAQPDELRDWTARLRAAAVCGDRDSLARGKPLLRTLLQFARPRGAVARRDSASTHRVQRNRRGVRHPGAPAAPEPEITTPPAPPRAAPTFAWKTFWIGAAAAACLGALVWGAVIVTAKSPDAAVRNFWRAFTASDTGPMVVFSNHRFVGSSSVGLRAYRDSVDSPQSVNETYSGTGTVMAVHELGDRASIGQSASSAPSC